MRILVLLLISTFPAFAVEKSPAPEFHYTVFLGKPAQEVWDALTTKATIDRYYMAPVRTLELKQGGKISYGTADAEVIAGTVLEYDPPKKFRHTFRFAGDSESTTTVTYAVTPVGPSMCNLTITHTGFQEKDQTYADVSTGWPVIASSLKTLLETGKPLPWPKP
jgi:uncharacterized protein YndB with AHSA1/START domain